LGALDAFGRPERIGLGLLEGGGLDAVGFGAEPLGPEGVVTAPQVIQAAVVLAERAAGGDVILLRL